MVKAAHISGINCDTPALEGIRFVLLSRLEEMCSLRDRALDWSDPEGVHDMRVSSRRLRGAIDDFAPYLRKRGLKGSMKEIKQVAEALGHVRDHDVAMIALQKLKVSVPDEAAATVDQFIRAMENDRKSARRQLRSAISKSALKQLQTDCTEAIYAVTEQPNGKKRKHERTYLHVAQATILQRLVEVEKLSSGFYDPLKVGPLHKLRISAKQLRYALELFEQCLGPEAISFARRVARLQSSLGELHDCDIWIVTFRERLGLAKRENSNGSGTGSLWLLSHFLKQHSKHLRTALAQWAEWERNEVGQQLRRLLKTEPSATAPDQPSSDSLNTLSTGLLPFSSKARGGSSEGVEKV
jgi:CHAD domain-containing protein